eukprot:TRINITY_DN1303_c0_g2_i2.p1 TRINITY_DN1303_c0_g2~~TRINITY_DN1303_c0_g2_i2.p1  ORF type:complete len:603 (+),score=199.79 TRINITY_DN1303_c0_g2_i2:256-1809(+)
MRVAVYTGPKPSQKMKQFHWAKLRGNQIKNTLFTSLKPNDIEIDHSLLESLFQQKVIAKKEVKADQPAKVVRVSLLDPKLLQNAGISLRQMQNSKDVKAIMAKSKKELSTIVSDALLSLDEIVLPVDRITMLLGCVPEKSAVDGIAAWLEVEGNSFDKLNEVDTFYHHLMKIPMYAQRLKCWRFVRNFEAENSELEVEMLKIQKGIRCIRANRHFKRVLEIVIAVGNFMNHGTRSGETVGFDIASLSKLAETRASVSANGTLMDFIITTVETKYPEAMGWTDEMKDLKFAQNSSWDKVDQLKNALRAQIMLSKQLSKTIQPYGAIDCFPEVIEKIHDYDLEFQDSLDLHASILTDWAELAKSYAKDPKKTKPEQFFSIIFNFSTAFTATIQSQKAKKAKEAAAKKKEDARKEIQRKKRELQQRKNALNYQKGLKEKTVSEEDSTANAQLGDMLSKMTGAAAQKRMDRTNVRNQRRASKSGPRRRVLKSASRRGLDGSPLSPRAAADDEDDVEEAGDV